MAHLALQTLVLVMDGSVVGRGDIAPMIHVDYKGRALPLAWLVHRGKKGHFNRIWQTHTALAFIDGTACLPTSGLSIWGAL